jgi:ketosteroid isomerase-like protein
MNKKLRALTEKYVEEFNNKNLPEVLSLMDENFKLTDPGNHIEGRADCGQFFKNLFINDISFHAHNIFVDGDHSIIHFKIKINDKTLHGTDIIKWNNNKMISLVAYL